MPNLKSPVTAYADDSFTVVTNYSLFEHDRASRSFLPAYPMHTHTTTAERDGAISASPLPPGHDFKVARIVGVLANDLQEGRFLGILWSAPDRAQAALLDLPEDKEAANPEARQEDKEQEEGTDARGLRRLFARIRVRHGRRNAHRLAA